MASEFSGKDLDVDDKINRIETSNEEIGALAFSFDYSKPSHSTLFSHSWEAVEQKPNQQQKFSSRQRSTSTYRRYPHRQKIAVGTSREKKNHYLNSRNVRSVAQQQIRYPYRAQHRTTTQMVGKKLADALLPPQPRRYNPNPSGKKDLWSRIVKGYAFPHVDNRRIQRFVKKMANNPKYVKKLSVKARPYLYYIVKEIEKRNMPLEIALLPAIESAFEPMALSHKSAAGLWQFIPATGREYGLKQNQWYDGRRDIMSSTRAALTYLQRLHKMFDGDWFLALASYNYGQGNVRRAIERNLRAGKPTDFWSLKLPRETRQYVPKLLALCKAIANPQDYDLHIASVADHPYLTQITIGHPIELNLAAELAGLPFQEFKLLNASYRGTATAPSGPHIITLPTYKAKSFKRRMAQIPLSQRMFVYLTPEKPSTIRIIYPDRNKSKIRQYRVGANDKLWNVKKRHNTNISMSRQPNQLAQKAPFRATRKLTVPMRKPFHRVNEGESLITIAKRYDVSITKLRQLNQIQGGEALQKGRVLKIPTNK